MCERKDAGVRNWLGVPAGGCIWTVTPKELVGYKGLCGHRTPPQRHNTKPAPFLSGKRKRK